MSERRFDHLCSSLCLCSHHNRCHPQISNDTNAKIERFEEEERQPQTGETQWCGGHNIENERAEIGSAELCCKETSPQSSKKMIRSQSTAHSIADFLGNLDSLSIDEISQTQPPPDERIRSFTGQKRYSNLSHCSYMYKYGSEWVKHSSQSDFQRDEAATSKVSWGATVLSKTKSVIASRSSVPDNRMTSKFFGSKREMQQDQKRQQESAAWIIHPLSSFR